jgi:hypothetical protein
MEIPPISWSTDIMSCGPFNFILEFSSNIKHVEAKYPEFILMKSRQLVQDYIENLKDVMISNALEWES